MATQNLMTEYQSKLEERFATKSFTEPWTSQAYDWNGAESIVLWTIDDVSLVDYDTNPNTAFDQRLGGAPELGDTIHTYTVRRKRGFRRTIQEVISQDQKFIKKKNAVMKNVNDTALVPENDRYRLNTWANGAGAVVINATALTATTIIRAMLTANAHLNNKHVPKESRVIFIGETLAIECRLAEELKYNDAWTNKAIVNGQITSLVGIPIVSVPDDLLPAGVNFMVKWKGASVDPCKMHKMRANDNVPGFFGTLIEGLFRYDSFVLANKADGIYVHCQTGAVATPTISISGTTATLACATSGATIKYTVDGTNPKISDTAQTGTSATVPAGETVRVYAYKTGLMNSGIAVAKNE